MIDQVSFFEFQSVGPQGELLKWIVNDSAILDYRISLTFDDDPRFVRLEARKAGGEVSYVQLLSISGIASITIKADPALKKAKK